MRRFPSARLAMCASRPVASKAPHSRLVRRERAQMGHQKMVLPVSTQARCFHSTAPVLEEVQGDPYEVLGVDRSATKKEIKAAYRKLAKKFHPDANKAPDAQQTFAKINAAYAILQDDQKRAQYDQFGHVGDMGDMGDMGDFGGFDFADLFGGGGRRRRRAPTHCEDSVGKLSLSLKDIMLGTVRKLRVTRSRLCKTCDGNGTKDKSPPKKCSGCGGQGFRITQQRIGPMVQQFQQECHQCGGLGETISAADRCGTCTGKRVVREKADVEVKVDAGVEHGDRIVLKGEGDEQPGLQAGNLVLVVDQQTDAQFERRGNDLFVRRTISLADALCGFKFTVTHLDGRTFVVKSAPGEVIKPGMIRAVEQEGIPDRRSFQKGHLFVQFDVEFPKEAVSQDDAKVIKEMFPSEEEDLSALPEDTPELELQALEPTANRRRRHQQQRPQEEEGVSCQSQ